jgi:hypothetical protein
MNDFFGNFPKYTQETPIINAQKIDGIKYTYKLNLSSITIKTAEYVPRIPINILIGLDKSAIVKQVYHMATELVKKSSAWSVL